MKGAAHNLEDFETPASPTKKTPALFFEIFWWDSLTAELKGKKPQPIAFEILRPAASPPSPIHPPTPTKSFNMADEVYDGAVGIDLGMLEFSYTLEILRLVASWEQFG